MSYKIFVNAIQLYLLNCHNTNCSDHTALKNLQQILQDCQKIHLPLKDRRKFQVSPEDFTPFNFNKNGITCQPVSNSNLSWSNLHQHIKEKQ